MEIDAADETSTSHQVIYVLTTTTIGCVHVRCYDPCLNWTDSIFTSHEFHSTYIKPHEKRALHTNKIGELKIENTFIFERSWCCAIKNIWPDLKYQIHTQQTKV